MPVDDSAMPPLKTPKTPAARKVTAAAVSTARARTEILTQLGGMAQMPLIGAKLYADAGTVSMHVPGIAAEVARLADAIPAVARVIDPLLQVGPYAGLITAVLPLVMQLAVNHGRAPAGIAGTQSPESISVQVEANLAQNELQALRVQQESEAEIRRIRAEIEQQRAEYAAAV